MALAKDIRVSKDGASHSLIGQRIQAGGALHTMKGGTIVVKNGLMYAYSEALNARITLAVSSATRIDITFQSRPCAPFRPAGVYHINKNVMNVRIQLAGQMRMTDGTIDAYVYTAGPFACDGQTHSVTDSASVPAGKQLYQVDIYTAEVLFNAEGMDAWAYRGGDIAVETSPWRFKAAAAVNPPGAGTAGASPANPAYGEIVTMTASDTNPAFRFTRWGSGKKDRSYAVKVFGDYSDTAYFASTANIVDFLFTVYRNSQGYLCVDAKSLQNKAEGFVMVSFDIDYLDRYGAGRTAHYEREVWLNETVDSYAFDDTTVSQIMGASQPEFGTMPYPLEAGYVQVEITNPYAAQSLAADPVARAGRESAADGNNRSAGKTNGTAQ